ncbi:hypothetical protein [Terricaulis silvestris]|uniref:DUF4345 domain-containing protein n=1 Tax=Terricaulis silvestris TaxID=2686094 RepID=A0A6I6MMI9_9CAUL|nr:hypothetical protein [Terricaulis silvestris]QGZ94476.1 hypothetical protein DSM104635_01295 [Terricaulis silvestris]
MLFAWILNALALALGAGLGARALYDPHWASRFVRLKADEQEGGFAEFRATFGGMIFLLHLCALVLTLRYVLAGGALVGVVATGASAAVAAAWGGAAFGRLVSMWRDKTDTKFNRLSVCVEVAMALAAGLPWLAWFFGG